MNNQYVFYSQVKPTGGEWSTPKRLFVKPNFEEAKAEIARDYCAYLQSPEGRTIECTDLEVYVADKDRELKIYALPD